MHNLVEVWFQGDLVAYITKKYYNIIEAKSKPNFYKYFVYKEIESEQSFTQMNNTLSEDHPVTKFHMSIVRLYKAKNYDPDIPWWEYDDNDLRIIRDTLCNTIKC
jgi:uncharacterized protein with NAD-binding domain and iron-sulfur cluster